VLPKELVAVSARQTFNGAACNRVGHANSSPGVFYLENGASIRISHRRCQVPAVLVLAGCCTQTETIVGTEAPSNSCSFPHPDKSAYRKLAFWNKTAAPGHIPVIPFLRTHLLSHPQV